jgi:hypothetical protein
MEVFFETITNTTRCNNQNLRQYNPYYIEEYNNIKKIFIDKFWFEDNLLDITKQRIMDIISYFTLDFEYCEISYPHDKFDEKYIDIYVNLYKAYLHQFNYDVWYDERYNDAKVIKIPNEDIELLDEWCDRFFVKFSDKDFNQLSKNFVKQINDAITFYNQKNVSSFFVKLSGTSGKKFHEIIPLFDTKSIIKFISQKSFKNEYEFAQNRIFKKDVCLIIQPWNDMFNERKHEFRAFMYNNKITCISQQVWHEVQNYTQEDLEYYKNIILKFENTSIYKNAIIDLYINDNKIHIIEYNSFGPYASAGSSLFNWHDDYDKIYNNDNKIYFRYSC